ncbi:polysaccharide biosynthesis/export family protein [Flavitalea sp. BT771]|uniref:polysaccharide biosynthesis/export family protein n=1 Tax=Flavitalea sp. BT771 TaxID=3063329 RepID=UPI0026E2ABEF|nr:polysaccharide biosynthesis/export family protein [Flavitalea sp. BT771]MDO6429414.1 polysaccharide biosynthesis/export family protein [Flavitalea sp. BT771]MDV6218458.1 polysaccharide biosynthesis/export family protein [Flavitalea sp. BT771]
MHSIIPRELVILLMILACMASCTGPRKMVYMYDLKDTSAGSISTGIYAFESLIQKNDQLWITVGGTNLEDLVLLNSGSGIVQGSNVNPITSNATVQALGYLVEADGTIKLPFLDKVKAEGLTRLQLESVLTEKLKDYTKNPVVNVRFLNYRVTVMGEVSHPGSFTIPNERLTVLEALGLAGDLLILGRRENVLVLREVKGVRSFGRLNLLSKDIVNSPYYYLKTNDVVYVEPASSTFIARERIPQYITISAASLSLLLTIVNITRK